MIDHIETIINSMTLKNGFGKCSLFVLSVKKIKTWPIHFPAKKTPNIEKALFDWPIVLQYEKYF